MQLRAGFVANISLFVGSRINYFVRLEKNSLYISANAISYKINDVLIQQFVFAALLKIANSIIGRHPNHFFLNLKLDQVEYS